MLKDGRLVYVFSIWLFTCLIGLLPQWQILEKSGFDLFSYLTAPEHITLPIVIVGIDEPSFAELNQQWPWPRSWHGRLVEQLSQQGASVIVFDILFAEPSSKEEDLRFSKALREAPTVVLAADQVFQETRHYQQRMRVNPYAMFITDNVLTGIAALNLDADNVVRQLPLDEDAMWRHVLSAYQDTMMKNPLSADTLIRYLSPTIPFDYVSYYQALDPEFFLPANSFRNKIVFVGLNLKTSPDPKSAQTDMFATPYLPYTGLLISGVELQATLVANELLQRHIRKASVIAQSGLNAVMIIFSFLAMYRWRPLLGLITSLGLVLTTFFIAWYLFLYADFWLPILTTCVGIVMVYIAQGGSAFWVERNKKQMIRNAFKHYVSPQFVEEMIAHPENLVLGGTRKELTLMFTDLVNFTGMAEKMEPEQTEKVLNEHLTAMTRIVQSYGGTVDKFIGDAIMAFWGAPLEDQNHALNACLAARDMQLEMEALRTKVSAKGGPELHLRIGVHTGVAVVGNMGSVDRFDYTAIGDNVNLASRLEGVNKIYGTGILISEVTAKRVINEIPMRRVDTVRVKGKTEPIEVYSLYNNHTLIELNDRAIKAYQACRWDESESLWREFQKTDINDPVAAMYLHRIDAFRKDPPPNDWGGILTLDKK